MRRIGPTLALIAGCSSTPGAATPVDAAVVSRPHPTTTDLPRVDAILVVKTRCVWENSRNTRVTRGENTYDAMSFSFTLYYPKVKVDPWSWGLPAFLSTTEVS